MTLQLRQFGVCFTLMGVILLKGTETSAQRGDAAVAQKIAELSSRLERASANPKERDVASSEVREEVKNFVESSLKPADSQEAIQKRLRYVLQTQVPDFEFSDAPAIRVANLRNGRALVLTYSVVRPPHFDLPTITAFSAFGGQFRQSASLGNDFEGYTLFTHEIPSPSKDELWLLAGGKAFTFNGSKFRFRVYKFDGNDFETLLAPDDVFDASVQILPDGFSISHYVREQQSSVTDQYKALGTGLIKVR